MRKLILLLLLATGAYASAQVEVRQSRLLKDGEEVPQLYGAEVQYFRLRGGYERNIPRERVIALWNKALDRVVEAKMNAISFYIPWDFHEYAEGKFDFTGTADEDGDGNPDYPARDVITFFKLAADHGIRRILVRPGPYINAEWGFLGFGAIPSWFHDKYPDSHMLTPWGWRRPLYDYLNPDLLRHTRLWFEALYAQVLKNQMGPGRPVLFLQIDNETNYQWQSVYAGDYSPRSQERYRDFLKGKYADLSELNQAQGSSWPSWEAVTPPVADGVPALNRDWYAFNDQIVFHYLGELRKIWEALGVREPNVLFTLAESYNAANHGLLPNYVYKNARAATGLMTVNLYPKTVPGSFLNQPFKADLDVKSASEAGNAYFGTRDQEWAMGPEIQGGWWRGIDVSEAARQQTYLSVIGHGLKSFFVYYFNEGQNLDSEWAFAHVKPLFDQLRVERQAETIPVSDLDNEFWGELQARSDRTLVMGLKSRVLMENGGPAAGADTLYFDAPLDENANPRGHYALLKKIGERVVAPYQDFLARALEVTDSIALVTDSTSHQPSSVPGLDSGLAESDWSGGLLGLLLNSGYNPRILFGDLSSAFAVPRALVHIDTGVNAEGTLAALHNAFQRGQVVINFLRDEVPRTFGMPLPQETLVAAGPQTLDFYVNSRGELSPGNEPDALPRHITANGPLFTYADLPATCEGILFWHGLTAGYRCGNLVQIGGQFFSEYNSDGYSDLTEDLPRREFMRAVLPPLAPQIVVSENAVKTVAFARKDPLRKFLWITVKTGAPAAQKIRISINAGLLHQALEPAVKFRVRELLAHKMQVLSLRSLKGKGFEISLPPLGSGSFVIEAVKP